MFDQHPATSAVFLRGGSTFDTFIVMARRLRRKTRSFMCSVVNGGHELYRARTDTKLFQQCLLCGHETPGWTIDRRDRRLHLVSGSSKGKRVA